jgi:type II secretory pathway pseudopilin PulG
MRRQAKQPIARRVPGFTVIELLLSAVVAGVAILVTLAIANGMTKSLRQARQNGSTQDNVMVAIDEVTRTLRGAGSGADYTSGQNRFIYAGPFTVGMNANLAPFDDPNANASPSAIDATLGDASVPLDGGASYTPSRTYATGAETILMTLDSNRDGALTTADAGDDPEEDSDNPNDYVLKSYVYGKSDDANTVATTGMALLRGPGGDGTTVEPLFKYWIDDDNDASTPAVLHGDADSDGRLSATEIAALDAVNDDQLALIERIDVAATAESEKPQHDSEYASNVLRSSVSFRNRGKETTRIVGTVFHDLDEDGTQDSNELGIRDVIIRLSNGSATKTDVDGNYFFALNPALYTVTEIDPSGYTSTTPNVLQVNPTPGTYSRADFGDLSGFGTGRILGTVYSDANSNGDLDTGERGIQGVRIFLDNGSSAYTDSRGRYSMTVQCLDYVVTEVDSIDYTSTTPNVVDVVLETNGDSVVVDFGDHYIGNSGTIHGIVYKDDDGDGVKDAGEMGLANATISLDDHLTTMSDMHGEFTFTATPGTHEVTETDIPGYTSSTVNTVHVTVVARQTVEVLFGDIPAQDVSFQEIVLGNTERALSIASIDMGEDNKADPDFVLGTHYVGGRNDLLAWWNNRTNASTPNASLFTTTPSHQRAIAADVNGLASWDLSGDGRGDFVSVLGSAANNIAVWITQSTGSNKGALPNSPTALYSSSGLSANDVVLGKFDSDAYKDFAVGTTLTTNMGKIEIFHGSVSGAFTRGTSDMLNTVPTIGGSWGAVVTLASADFNNDGYTDLVAGARISTSASKVFVLLYSPTLVSGMNWVCPSVIDVQGQVTDVLALDMIEDDQPDVDVIIATELTSTSGEVQVWHNRGDNTFGQGDTANTTPDDTANPGGSPLSMTTAKIDNDIFPDLIVGTRTALYSGGVVLYRAFGYLPTNGTQMSTTNSGETITMTSADYNKDGAPDISVGTRNSSTSGKVVIFYNQRSAL